MRAELVAIAWQMVHQHGLAAGRSPPCGITARPSAPAVAAPENDQWQREAARDVWQCRWMPERVRTIQHGRRDGAEPRQHASALEEIAHQGLATRNELVGEHVPRPGFDRTRPKTRGQLFGALGSYREIVVEENRLP